MGKLNTHIASLVLCFTTWCAVASDSRWYQGCYQDLSLGRQDAPDGDNMDTRASKSGSGNVTDQNKCSVVECCRKCFLQRFEYAALQSEELCRCHRNQDDLRIISNELCLYENRTEQDYLPLPCGQMNVSWSVFRSSGPYIVNISVTMDTPWVVTGRPVVIEVVTDLASFVNISDEIPSSLDPFEMLMEWSFDDLTGPGSLGLRAEGTEVYGRISHTFDTAGNNTFYVNVSNILSQAEIEVVVNVIHPEPRDLEISLLQHISELPSCTPGSWTSKGRPFIRVFMDEPFDIEASIAMGTNLTFGFEMDNETAIIVKPWDLDPPCRDWNCSAVYKEFVLSAPGRHHLRVAVHNQFGRLQKTWTIFVVQRYLDDPTFTMTTGSKDVVSPGEPIRFLVALEITARIGATLEVEFGDGEHHSTELKDTNSTSMALYSDHGPMMVVASYGQGCRLQVQFEHAYHRQGTYRPHMTVYNGNDSVNNRQQNVTGKFQGYIRVINRLNGARLESKHTVAVGQISKFQVELMSPSLNVSYHWSIMDEHDNDLGMMNTSVNHIWYNFSEAGVYQVSVRAANIISEVQTATTIVVQEPLTDLQLTCNPKTCIRVDQLLLCSATVVHGSNPKFIWKIPNRHTILSSVTKQHGLSMANYTFDMRGRFNISVQAKNDVSDITKSVDSLICVQEPVTCVSIESYGPVPLGRATEFEITVAPMTFVMFKFESGLDRRLWESVTVQQFLQDDGFYVAYEFEQAGIHDVTVTAYNNVSSASHSIKVLVMRAVPPLDVKVIGAAMVGRPTTLQIIPKWPYGVTDNLEYEWHIDNYTLYGTGSTIVTTTFNRPGYHQVNVTAANFVENRTKTLYVDVVEPSSVEWYLSHDIVVPINQPVDFILQGASTEGNMLHVEYDGPQYVKRLVDDADYRWSQEFAEAGLYQTVVTMATDKAGSNTIDSLVLVQERITGLQLTGPQMIKIEILYKDYFWEAGMDSGTDVMYHWSLLSMSGGPNITGPSYGVLDKYRRQFDVPGMYNLVVAARNNVSQSQASLLITVLYPVTRVTVQTRPIPLGHTSYINITVTGADTFNVQVDFGDNTSTEVSTLQYNSNIFRLSEISFIVMTSHLYTIKSTYKVSVNVSNQVSSLEESGIVLVGEPITGVKLHTNSPALVQVAEWVVVTATVATGDDLTFEWDFSDEVYEPSQYLKVVSEGNNSTANYSFSMAGQYDVSVRVSNQLYTQPFIVQLDFQFHVMEVVSQLTVEIYEKITGSPLQGSAPNLSTPEVRFLSKCGGSDVTFEFNFGDGVTKQVSGILHQYVNIMMATSSHRYTKEGVYNVSVTARNSLSEMTSYLALPFYVQLPTQGLQLHPEMIRTPFGEETTFRASVTGGTNFTFDWKFGDQSDIVNDAGPIVTHEYTQVGRYEVTVIAKNDVSQLTKTAEVQVLHRLQRVNLMLSKKVVATYEEVKYSAETFPENADVGYFEWNFGVQEKPKQSYDPFKTHMYTIPSKYTVTVSAHNSISHVESEPVYIHVQSPVSEYLEIRYDPKKKHHIVEENSSFSVYHFSGSDLYYTWDFGDGTRNKTTKSKTMSHNYTSVGEYVIRVWAENMLSMTSASDNVFVLRKKCVKPELVIHGEFTKGESVSIHVLRSKELYVEVELKNVDCDVTNATAYRWAFYNASSGREVELDTLDDDVLRKKMLRIPARILPYGTYDLKVTVMVRGTIVHTECRTKVSVDPTQPLCSIKGGVYREVRRDGVVVIDGTSSLDPDINSNSSLRFNWTCYVDYDREKPCFKENLTDTVTMDTSRISFPGSWLREDRREFMMTLTLMTENRDDVECSQMIHISDLLELNIYCPQCEQSLVNWDWSLSFQAVCSTCDPVELEYEWTIYMVPDLGQSNVNHRYDKFSRTCAIAGQTHISKLVHGNKTLLFNVDSSRYNAIVIPADTHRTDGVSQGGSSTTTLKPMGLYYPIEDHSEGRSRGKDFSPPMTFQESRSTSGRQRGSDNILETADTPQKDDDPAKFDSADVPKTEGRHSRRNIADRPRMDSKHDTLDTADIPRMDHRHNTLDTADIPQMDHRHNTLDTVDIPQMDHRHNTLDTADIPRMESRHNTLDTADIPRMESRHNTLDTADIPQMESRHNTLDTVDIPRMEHSHNTLDTADIPQMESRHNTLDAVDIPRMDHRYNTLDTADIPRMDHRYNTLDTADIPQMDSRHNTLDTVDIPRMDHRYNTLDTVDIPRMDHRYNTLDTADIPRMDHRHNTLDTADIPRMDHSHNTLDTADIPRMESQHNTLDTADIPHMDHMHNTLDTADIPQMDSRHSTFETADIPRMESRHNTLDTADIPHMDHRHNTLDTQDIPRMESRHNTLDTADIPHMDHKHNTLDSADIPQMESRHNTLDSADIPQMESQHNTLDTADIPQMESQHDTLDTADIPKMDHSHDTLDTADNRRLESRHNTLDTADIPELEQGHDTLDTADIPPIEDFGLYNPIIEENTRVESSRRKPLPHTDMFELKEGSPGEEGSSIARNPAYDNDIFEDITSGNRPKPGMDENENPTENEGDPVISDPEGSSEPARQKHILQHAHYPMVLVWNATLTGLDKRSLVLKPNNEAIQQGSTYIMHVRATTKDGSTKGHAMAQFKVNQSPHQGDCSVKPDSGFEMSTEFTIFCKEWRDVEEHLPLWYEVSYNLEESDVRYVIYRGLRSSINFILPAGNPNNKHRVFVYITILDSLSGRTPVCHAPLTVRPQPPEQVRATFEAVPSPEETIFYEAFNGNGSIVKAQEQGYEHRVKVLVRYLATRLNQLPQIGTEVKEQRQEIRHKLLGILKHLPMRDELEVIQTLQALAALTEVASELNQAELDLASAVFRSILDRASELYSEALTPTHELLTLAVTTASNVISATVRSAARDKAERWFYHTSMSASIHTLDQLLKNELKFHAIGQEPIKKHAYFVTTMASRFSLKDRPVLKIDQSKFTLPKDMSVIMKKDSCPLDTFSPNHDCFQVHMTKFLRNPYVFDHNKNTKVGSEVGALKIYTCDGELVQVSGLQDSNMVTMEIPRLPLKEEATLSELVVQHRLERTVMNLHQFNVSKGRQRQSLNIVFTLTPAFEERLFPIALMIGFQDPPTPDKYLLRREFDVTTLQGKLFLPASYFNVTGSYYLGVVDGGYNSGRHRPGEATQRNYTLKIWWANCLYWNESGREWSDDGCWSTGESTYYVTHCRCNHLTAFGSHFDLVPNELSFVAVEDFFSRHENPITITLIGVILCLYAILMVICHRADIHDAKKGGITYLQDNTITDQQRFEVTVETGFRKGSGTTAKISLILHGEEGMSETRELITDDRRPLFERNSRDKFILTLPDSIGKIWKVQIWHNNSGQSPSWYLSRVIVKDLNNGNVYYFLSEKWLAVEEEDGKVEREFMALEGSLGVRKVFWAKGTQYMADHHLWTSLFTHPSPSHFTRTQRLTCCLTLLMMYMCLNAMWYKQAPSEVRGEFGLLDLSLRNVTVGAMCCAVAIPVNLFLALLFRRSKKQRSTGEVDPELEEEKDKHYPSGKPDGAPQDDDEDSEAVQPVMTYSILDQSILNWPSIQDWAQKQWMKRQHSTMSIEETTSGKTNDNTLQQGQTTLTPTHILHKRVIGSETDQASSGFEDSNSTDPRPQMTISSQASSIKNKAPSVSSSVSQKSSVLSARKNFERRVFLPYWFQYVAWTLCTIICLGCAVVTVLYGFRFGQTKGMMWLQSLYFSAVVCIFISHPLMICIAVVYTAIKYRNNPSILDHCEDGYFGEQAKLEILRRKKEKAKEILDENKEIERGVAARQRSRYLRFARPPQEKQLIEARKKILKEKKAMSLVSNSVGFFVMLTLVCVMAYGKDIVTSPFYLNEAIKNTLISSGVVKFADISQPGDWYTWSQTTMLNTLYTDQGQQENNSKVIQQKFALHGSSFVIGQIHLRQMRVVKEPCVQKLPHLPEYCLHDYSYTNKMKDVSPDMNETWTENTAFFNIFGKHGVYDNSGFVIKLDNSRSKALSQLQQLEYQGWINKHTRAVVVELTLFNAPTNLFSSVALVMELPPTGGAFMDHRVMSTYLYRYMTPTDNFVLACELFFVILTLYKMKNEVCNWIKLKRNYLHSAWNIVQCLMVALSLTYIGCYLYRFMLVWEALENMRSTYFEQFVDVSFLAVWDEILQVQVGVILFLVFIKSLRLLRYNRLFALFGNVCKRVHKEFIIFTALFCGLLLAFSSLGLLLFGSFCWSFHDYWTTLFTLMSLMTGHYQHPGKEHTMTYFLRVFVFCFCVFFTGLLTSYVIAFLSFRFRVYRRKQSDILAMSGRDALLFFWKQFLMWTGIRYEPPVHEPENELPAEFTMVEIEYQVDELYFRINALSGLHSLPEKPTGYLTDSDGTYGVGDDGISSGGSEMQQGEEERLDHRVQQIEDYLYSQEPYLAQLLKMDNTDPDLLSQEKEKQLKSHLEMEIFRQLQIQRQDTDQPTSSKVKAGSSQGKKVEVDGVKGVVKDGGSDNQKKSVFSYAPPDESNSNESCDIDPQTSSSSNPESPRDHDKSGSKAIAEKQVRVSVGQTDKSGSQSSDSDKGLFTKGLKNEVKQKKPEPPPKPTFIKHSIRDVVSHDASRPGGSPALRQLRSSLNTIERLSFKGDNSGSSFTTESSSGSEQDAIHGMQRPHGKQRNLRKTKSRGKGKGSVNLTGSLLDELDTEDKEELEQYEFEIQNTEDQVEQETTSGQSDSANKTPCDKRPIDKEPIKEQETAENKEEVERCSVKDSIKAFEKRAGNS